MPKQPSTLLRLRFLQLPRLIDFELDIIPEMEKVNISRETFASDLKVHPGTIPFDRLEFYAKLLNCHISDFFDLSIRTKVILLTVDGIDIDSPEVYKK